MDQDHARRTDLVARLADHVLATGLGSASLRPLAAAVGTSDRMLLYYFPDKATLIAAVLKLIAARMTTLLDAHTAAALLPKAALEEQLVAFVLDDALWPFMQIWLEIAAYAARGDAMFARVGNAIANGFLDWTQKQLCAADAATGRIEAARVLMTVEGAVLLKSLGLGEAVAATLGMTPVA